MNELIVIKYTGNHFKIGSLTNFNQSFKRYSGIIPSIVLDEESKDEIFNYLRLYNKPETSLIIHIQAHGSEEGICKELQVEETNIGDIETLITWNELIDIFNEISDFCNNLTVNLGAVCNSHFIADTIETLNFDIIASTETISDILEPRKYNKQIIENQGLSLSDKYMHIPKVVN